MNRMAKSVQAADPWLPRNVQIEEIIAETPNVWTFRISSMEGGFPEFSPGQFNMVYVPGFGEAAISISSGIEALPLIDHTVRAAGDVTGAITRLQVNDQLGLRGPFGKGWPMAKLLGRDVLVVAGGVGLAPLRPAVEHMLQNRREYGSLKLIYGAKTPQDLLYRREIAAWGDAGLEIEQTVDRGTSDWKGAIGVVTELMRPSHGTTGKTSVLTCGPEIMMRFVAREAILLGVDPSEIYVSMERNMKCAMGMCGVCQFGPEFICKDGPVFPFSKVASYMKLVDL